MRGVWKLCECVLVYAWGDAQTEAWDSLCVFIYMYTCAWCGYCVDTHRYARGVLVGVEMCHVRMY